MKRCNGLVRILLLFLKALNVIRLVGVIVDWFFDGFE